MKLIIDVEPGDRLRLVNALEMRAAARNQPEGEVQSALRIAGAIRRGPEPTDQQVIILSGNAATDISALVGLAEAQGHAVAVGDSTDGSGTRWLVHDQDGQGNDIAVSVQIHDPYEEDEDTLIEHGWDGESDG